MREVSLFSVQSLAFFALWSWTPPSPPARGQRRQEPASSLPLLPDHIDTTGPTLRHLHARLACLAGTRTGSSTKEKDFIRAVNAVLVTLHLHSCFLDSQTHVCGDSTSVQTKVEDHNHREAYSFDYILNLSWRHLC